MTAVVSREHARTTCLTGATGMLMVAIAFVMMIVAAPGHGHARAGVVAKPAAAQVTTDVCHRLTSRSSSATVRACLAGPSAASAWADAHHCHLTSLLPLWPRAVWSRCAIGQPL
ncbi:MAG TPA: hypothetical protein VFQ68_42520 [Streptosporangiaceae bacterium]|nr:hypothetical protein [Streptosporangiaceae bacterium]